MTDRELELQAHIANIEERHRNERRDTDPADLQPAEDSDPTPRDPRSPYEEMLEAAVINQRLADQYRGMLDSALLANNNLRQDYIDAVARLDKATSLFERATVIDPEDIRQIKSILQGLPCNPGGCPNHPHLSVVPDTAE